MGLADLLPRVTAITGIEAPKGAPYTWAELDNNLQLIYEALVSLLSGGNIAPYNALTEYSNVKPDYVSHAGNIFKFIGASPATGQTPPTPPATSIYWELTSAGALTHQQNSDLYLNFAGANQVSAASLYELLNNQWITITEDDFAALVQGSDLKKNRQYHIGNAVPPLVVTASHINAIFPAAIAIITVPNRDEVPETWVDTGSYAIGAKVQWDMKVWNNTTGTQAGTPPAVDTTNWALVPSSDPTYYQTIPYAADVSLAQNGGGSIGYIYINSLTDLWNNRWGSTMAALRKFPLSIETISENNKLEGSVTGLENMYRVKGCRSTFDSTIGMGDGGRGTLDFVTVDKATILNSGAWFKGALNHVNLLRVRLLFPDGFSETGSLTDLTVIGKDDLTDYKIRAGAICSGIVTPAGSTVEDVITSMPGGTDLDLASNGYSDIYGVYKIAGTPGMTILSISNWPANLDSVIIMPWDSGNEISLRGAAISTISADGTLTSDVTGTSFTAKAGSGDYFKLTRRLIDNGTAYSVYYFEKFIAAP